MAGNAGNAGNAGGVGAVNSDSDGSIILPDRVDLPFVTVTQMVAGVPTPIAAQTVAIAAYPHRNWSAEWRAWVALCEYAALAPAWQAIALAPWANPTVPPGAGAPSEIDQLVTAARDERADALGEIVAQNEEFASYFLALLTITPNSHPGTWRVINIASIVGMFTVMYFKTGAGGKLYPPRPRPSQVCPALAPPVPVPGHASYPSGHSTEAHLIANCLNDVLTGSIEAATMQIDLGALADRIARNREIAGLHYPSDSAAGVNLAGQILPIVQGMQEYKDALAIAQAEWVPPGSNP
jgi:hypothetical protein